MDEDVDAVCEVDQGLERGGVAADGETVAEAVRVALLRVAGLECLDLEAREGERLARVAVRLEVDPLVEVVDREQVPEDRFGPLGPGDREIVVIREEPGFGERRDVGDVVKVGVGQQDRVDVGRVDTDPRESVQDTATTVDQQRPRTVFDEDSRLDALGRGQRAPDAEEGRLHIHRWAVGPKTVAPAGT